MILYHGSFVVVDKPGLNHSRDNVDFGKGFYVTPIYDQAKKWCERYKKREKKGIITSYELDERLFNSLKVLKFDTYSEQWLDFILKCRRKNDTSDYDLVIGGAINDKIFNTLELFYDGLIDKNEAINRLKYEKPNLQIIFRTNKALSCLIFKRSEQL